MSALERFAASLARAGRGMVLKRRVGTGSSFVSATVKGKATAYQPQELVGGVIQGDRKVRIAQADLTAAGWPGAAPVGVTAGQWPDRPSKGDSLDGSAVQGAEALYDGETLVGWKVWVRG